MEGGRGNTTLPSLRYGAAWKRMAAAYTQQAMCKLLKRKAAHTPRARSRMWRVVIVIFSLQPNWGFANFLLRVDNGIFKITSKSDDALLDAVRTSVGKRTRVNLKNKLFQLIQRTAEWCRERLKQSGKPEGCFGDGICLQKRTLTMLLSDCQCANLFQVRATVIISRATFIDSASAEEKPPRKAQHFKLRQSNCALFHRGKEFYFRT